MNGEDVVQEILNGLPFVSCILNRVILLGFIEAGTFPPQSMSHAVEWNQDD